MQLIQLEGRAITNPAALVDDFGDEVVVVPHWSFRACDDVELRVIDSDAWFSVAAMGARAFE